MKQYDIYGLGAALVDTEIEVEDSFLQQSQIEKGLMTLVDEARQHELMSLLQDHLVACKRSSGGSAANSIIAASYMGASNYYSCKVANDDNGQFYLNDLQQAGVDACFEQTKESGITGKCLVMISPDAERTMNTFLGISETLSADNLNLDALKASKWLYFEGYLVTSETGRTAAIKAREFAEANAVKTSMSLSDPAMVQFFKEGLVEMIGTKMDLIFCNHEEALSFANSDNLDDAVAALKLIANSFAITQGDKGAIVFDGEQLIDIEPFKVKAIDSNGAGDAFAGAFLYAINHGLNYAQAGQLASYTAAQVVSQFGPRLNKGDYLAALQQLNFAA